MTNEEKCQAIAKASGHKYHKPTAGEIKSGSYYQNEPDYLNNRDAIHAVILNEQTNVRDLINLELCDSTAGHFDHSETHDLDAALHATAEQWCEAFLKVKGLLK